MEQQKAKDQDHTDFIDLKRLEDEARNERERAKQQADKLDPNQLNRQKEEHHERDVSEKKSGRNKH